VLEIAEKFHPANAKKERASRCQTTRKEKKEQKGENISLPDWPGKGVEKKTPSVARTGKKEECVQSTEQKKERVAQGEESVGAKEVSERAKKRPFVLLRAALRKRLFVL